VREITRLGNEGVVNQVVQMHYALRRNVCNNPPWSVGDYNARMLTRKKMARAEATEQGQSSGEAEVQQDDSKFLAFSTELLLDGQLVDSEEISDYEKRFCTSNGAGDEWSKEFSNEPVVARELFMARSNGLEKVSVVTLRNALDTLLSPVNEKATARASGGTSSALSLLFKSVGNGDGDKARRCSWLWAKEEEGQGAAKRPKSDATSGQKVAQHYTLSCLENVRSYAAALHPYLLRGAQSNNGLVTWSLVRGPVAEPHFMNQINDEKETVTVYRKRRDVGTSLAWVTLTSAKSSVTRTEQDKSEADTNTLLARTRPTYDSTGLNELNASGGNGADGEKYQDVFTKLAVLPNDDLKNKWTSTPGAQTRDQMQASCADLYTCFLAEKTALVGVGALTVPSVQEHVVSFHKHVKSMVAKLVGKKGPHSWVPVAGSVAKVAVLHPTLVWNWHVQWLVDEAKRAISKNAEGVDIRTLARTVAKYALCVCTWVTYGEAETTPEKNNDHPDVLVDLAHEEEAMSLVRLAYEPTLEEGELKVSLATTSSPSSAVRQVVVSYDPPPVSSSWRGTVRQLCVHELNTLCSLGKNSDRVSGRCATRYVDAKYACRVWWNLTTMYAKDKNMTLSWLSKNLATADARPLAMYEQNILYYLYALCGLAELPGGSTTLRTQVALALVSDAFETTLCMARTYLHAANGLVEEKLASWLLELYLRAETAKQTGADLVSVFRAPDGAAASSERMLGYDMLKGALFDICTFVVKKATENADQTATLFLVLQKHLCTLYLSYKIRSAPSIQSKKRKMSADSFELNRQPMHERTLVEALLETRAAHKGKHERGAIVTNCEEGIGSQLVLALQNTLADVSNTHKHFTTTELLEGYIQRADATKHLPKIVLDEYTLTELKREVKERALLSEMEPHVYKLTKHMPPHYQQPPLTGFNGSFAFAELVTQLQELTRLPA